MYGLLRVTALTILSRHYKKLWQNKMIIYHNFCSEVLNLLIKLILKFFYIPQESRERKEIRLLKEVEADFV